MKYIFTNVFLYICARRAQLRFAGWFYNEYNIH